MDRTTNGDAPQLGDIAPDEFRRQARRVLQWIGDYHLSERMEYTPTSLSQPIRAVFKVFFKPRNQTEKESFGANPYLLKTVKIETAIKNIFEDLLYTPIVSSFIFFFDKVRRLQTGKINAYLLYIMITLVLLLLFVRLSNNA